MNTPRYSLDPFINQLQNDPNCCVESLDGFIKVKQYFENSSYSYADFDLTSGNLRYSKLLYQSGKKTIDVTKTEIVFLPDCLVQHRLQTDLTLLWDLKNSKDLEYFIQCIQDKKIEKFPIKNLKFKTPKLNFSKSIRNSIDYNHSHAISAILNKNIRLNNQYRTIMYNLPATIEYCADKENYYLIYRIITQLNQISSNKKKNTTTKKHPDIDLEVLNGIIQQHALSYVGTIQNKKTFEKYLQKNHSLEHIERIQNFVQDFSQVYDVKNYEINHECCTVNTGSQKTQIQVGHLTAKIQIEPWVFVGDDSCYSEDCRGGQLIINHVKKLLK